MPGDHLVFGYEFAQTAILSLKMVILITFSAFCMGSEFVPGERDSDVKVKKNALNLCLNILLLSVVLSLLHDWLGITFMVYLLFDGILRYHRKAEVLEGEESQLASVFVQVICTISAIVITW